MTEAASQIRSMPAEKQVVAAAAAERLEPDDFDLRLWLANGAAATLVGLWWVRRRKSTRQVPAQAAYAGLPQAAAHVPSGPERTGGPLAAAAPAGAMPAATPDIVPSAVPPRSPPATPIAEPRPEPRNGFEAVRVEPAPPPAPAPPTPPKAPEPGPAVLQPVPATLSVDFLLEEADPEVVARENARLNKLKATTPAKVPAKEQETNLEPTLQLAEIMLSMGLEQGAAQALLEYTEANPRQAVYHWLKLLGIYRKRGLQNEFIATAEKLRQHFNIQAEDWVKEGTADAPTLESFARVSDHVQQTWARPAECLSYLKNLLEDNRAGARAGFPQAVAEEILLLIEVLKDSGA